MLGRARALSKIIGIVACLMSFGAVAAHTRPLEKTFRIGFLTGSSLAADPAFQAFRRNLRRLGYVEDKNIIIEARSTNGNPLRRRENAAELVRLHVNVIVAVGPGDIRAARAATSTIPIVMVVSGDAVRSRFVASLSRPGGNVTGLSTFLPELSAKRLELLKEVVPGISRVVVLSPSSSRIQKPLRQTAEAIGVTLQYLDVSSPGDIETAFRAAVEGQADAVLFQVAKPVFILRLEQVVQLAMKYRLPVIYDRKSEVQAGGLMSYGVNRLDLFRYAARYVDKILKGTKPADLPVQRPTKFELVVNLKAAKGLALTIPSSILLRADRVIE